MKFEKWQVERSIRRHRKTYFQLEKNRLRQFKQGWGALAWQDGESMKEVRAEITALELKLEKMSETPFE